MKKKGDGGRGEFPRILSISVQKQRLMGPEGALKAE